MPFPVCCGLIIYDFNLTELSPTENLRVAQSSVKYDRFHVLWNKVKEAEKYLISIS